MTGRQDFDTSVPTVQTGDAVTIWHHGCRCLGLVLFTYPERKTIVVETVPERGIVECTEDELTKGWRIK